MAMLDLFVRIGISGRICSLPGSIRARLANDGRKEEEFTSLTPKEALEWLTEDSQDGKIKYGFQKILRKFGHRCLREFDLDR